RKQRIDLGRDLHLAGEMLNFHWVLFHLTSLLSVLYVAYHRHSHLSECSGRESLSGDYARGRGSPSVPLLYRSHVDSASPCPQGAIHHSVHDAGNAVVQSHAGNPAHPHAWGYERTLAPNPVG